MPNGESSTNGFEALRSLDTNQNGIIDDNDELFGGVSNVQNNIKNEYTLFDQLIVKCYTERAVDKRPKIW